MTARKADNLQQCVCVVGSDQSVEEALSLLSVSIRGFFYASDCLAQLRSQRCDLLITDIEPERKGLQVLEQVRGLAPWVPVFIVTRYADVSTAVRAVKYGAADFIGKPFETSYFIRRVKLILAQNRTVTTNAIKTLTPNEMKVFRLIIEGYSSRKIAEMTSRHVKTIELHRAAVMRKLGARNVIDLIRLGAETGLVAVPEEQGDGQWFGCDDQAYDETERCSYYAGNSQVLTI